MNRISYSLFVYFIRPCNVGTRSYHYCYEILSTLSQPASSFIMLIIYYYLFQVKTAGADFKTLRLVASLYRGSVAIVQTKSKYTYSALLFLFSREANIIKAQNKGKSFSHDYTIARPKHTRVSTLFFRTILLPMYNIA